MHLSPFELTAILLAAAALFGYLNHRFIRLPQMIGVMALALAASVVLVVLGRLGLQPVSALAANVVGQVDYRSLLLEALLGLLLFAGALHVNLDDLFEKRHAIASFATIGLLITTALVGTATFYLLRLLGIPIDFGHALLFGAIVAPTDPVAVIGIMRRAGAPATLEAKIVGESLFNDGIAVVVFATLVAILAGSGGGGEAAAGVGGHGEGHAPVLDTVPAVALFLLREAGGGLVLGLMAGLLGYVALRAVDDHRLEALITASVAVGSYALAGAIAVSAPLTAVVVGLLIGNRGRRLAMSTSTREALDTFWELVDEILNALLFLLTGLELLALTISGSSLLAGVLVVPVVLASRAIGIGTPVAVLRRRHEFSQGAVRVITWAGLRGGISVALALSLPSGPERALLITMTYCVVAFSILVQGPTLSALIGRHLPEGSAAERLD